MGVMTDKVKAELKEFYQEIFVDNADRYRHPKEWLHLYVDLWVSLLGMSYTLGHALAIAVPALLLLNAI